MPDYEKMPTKGAGTGSGVSGELHQRPEKAALKAERQQLAHGGISPRATQA
jgi:hypothetical protein